MNQPAYMSYESVDATPASPLRVLVVDDDQDSRQLIGDALASFGYDCRVASNGAEAWEMHHADPADVILSDWRMPCVDGIELCRRARVADGSSGYTYFILMTAFGDKQHFLDGMGAGADDYLTKPIDLDALSARLVSASRVMAVQRRLAERNARLTHDSQVSFRLARVDALTTVGNRLRMNEDLAAIWARAQRHADPCCIAICDVDDFKAYNDSYGHLAGDDALRFISQRIRDELRRGDAVYRYGGEEFLAVLPDQSLTEAKLAMNRVRRSVEALGLPTKGPRGRLTISVGVAQLVPKIDRSLEAWLKRADDALYAAKARGRNRVELSARE
jgi:two-component system chemotaxis response regulator CheY